MMVDIKLRLDPTLVEAIDEARANKLEWLQPSGRSIPPSRAEMIRRLIERSLQGAAAHKALAASKKRAAESRERTRKLRQEQPK